MEQNGMEDISELLKEQHPWYTEPEEASAFQTAAEI